MTTEEMKDFVIARISELIAHISKINKTVDDAEDEAILMMYRGKLVAYSEMLEELKVK